VSFLIAFAAAFVFCPVLAAVGMRLGLVDRPGALKIHRGSVPVTGGPSVVAAVLLGVGLVGYGDVWVAAAACLALGGGLIDDVRSLPPWARLMVQASAGAVLVAGGLRLEPLGELGGPGLVVATVACCNAVNMVDGQDGLAAGLGVIAAVGISAVLAATGEAAALPLAVAGALAAFLVWNRPPARMFLGDGGAYAVGLLLATSAAQATAEGWLGLLASGACLGVFAYELVSTIVRRLASAVPTVRGDRDHSYDRLGDRLGSRSTATLLMWASGVVAALVGLAVLKMPPLLAVALIAAVTLAAAVLDAQLPPVSRVKGDR
jgi:UDP-GlcNAc:undecaprenyl-phosphate GlcNAc-1-phosphate transferase